MKKKDNKLLLKETYFPILKKYHGKKLLFKKWHSTLNKICERKELKNKIFSYSSWENPNEGIIIAESLVSDYSYFNYTDSHTRMGRMISFCEFNNIIHDSKWKMKIIKRRKKVDYTLQLEKFYAFQVALFQNSPELTFEEYALSVLETPLPIIDPFIEAFAKFLMPRPFMLIKDGTKNYYPSIEWERGYEVVRITKFRNGIEVKLIVYHDKIIHDILLNERN